MKKKTLFFIGTFLVVYVLNFLIPSMMPGDPFLYMQEISESASSYSEEDLQSLRSYYGLDKPVGERFIQTVRNNIHGEFGQSIFYKQSVRTVVLDRLPWTVFIMTMTLLLSLLIGVLLAGISVQHPRFDANLYHFMSVIAEIPAYLIGFLVLFLIAAKVKWIPVSGARTPFANHATQMENLRDILLHALMPVLSLTIVTVPGFYFTSRTSFKTVLGKKYILNAQAKGLSKYRILFSYILLNAVLPIVAHFFLSIGFAVGGTMLVENVFAYPGLGTTIRLAVRYRDYPLIQGVFLLSTAMVMISSFVSDLINYYLSRRTNDTNE